MRATGQYDRNRVIALGGTEEFKDENTTPGADPFDTQANHEVYELVSGAWLAKAPLTGGRTYANLVPMPDGNLLLLGGADKQAGSNMQFYATPLRFRPGLPTSAGEWEEMARRPDAVLNTASQQLQPIPRGYHSTAILLQDGRIALFGGIEHGGNLVDRGIGDTVEIYSPPYMFEAQRLRILGAMSSGTSTYGSSICVDANRPGDVAYAVLLGTASATHHFDYGQRYIEVPVVPNPTVCGSGFNLEVLMPATPSMAPEGYYLLFLVELRGQTAIPSTIGRFVRLTT